MKRTALTILRKKYIAALNSEFCVQWKYFSTLVYSGVGWSPLDDIEMPRVLQRLSQMTNTVQKTTELILFGPLPVVYSLDRKISVVGRMILISYF